MTVSEEDHRRKILHCNVTRQPNAFWIVLQPRSEPTELRSAAPPLWAGGNSGWGAKTTPSFRGFVPKMSAGSG
jgi:hypothetical protein